MVTAKEGTNRFVGWPGYVVPAKLVAEEILARKHEAYVDLGREDAEFGWRTTVAERAAKFAGGTCEAMQRRLYTVLKGESVIVSAELADCLLLAVGCYMNEETTIPNLPGCNTAAREMVDVYAETHNLELTLKERKVWVKALMEFTADVLYGPASTLDKDTLARCQTMTASHFDEAAA